MSVVTIPIAITKTIAQEYARRNAFPEIRPGQPSFTKKFSTSERYRVGYKLALKILDDAYEQSFIRRGRHGAGITRAYTALAKDTRFFLKHDLGFDPAEVFFFVSGPDPEFMCCGVVEDAFRRIGIPLAEAKAG